MGYFNGVYRNDDKYLSYGRSLLKNGDLFYSRAGTRIVVFRYEKKVFHEIPLESLLSGLATYKAPHQEIPAIPMKSAALTYEKIPQGEDAVQDIAALVKSDPVQNPDNQRAILLRQALDVSTEVEEGVVNTRGLGECAFDVHVGLFQETVLGDHVFHVPALINNPDVVLDKNVAQVFEPYFTMTIHSDSSLARYLEPKADGTYPTLYFRRAPDVPSLIERAISLENHFLIEIIDVKAAIAYPYRFIPDVDRAIVNSGGIEYRFRDLFDEEYSQLLGDGINLRMLLTQFSGYYQHFSNFKRIGFSSKDIADFAYDNFIYDWRNGCFYRYSEKEYVGGGYFLIDKKYLEIFYRTWKKSKYKEIKAVSELVPTSKKDEEYYDRFTMPLAVISQVVTYAKGAKDFEAFYQQCYEYFLGCGRLELPNLAQADKPKEFSMPPATLFPLTYVDLHDGFIFVQYKEHYLIPIHYGWNHRLEVCIDLTADLQQMTFLFPTIHPVNPSLALMFNKLYTEGYPYVVASLPYLDAFLKRMGAFKQAYAECVKEVLQPTSGTELGPIKLRNDSEPGDELNLKECLTYDKELGFFNFVYPPTGERMYPDACYKSLMDDSALSQQGFVSLVAAGTITSIHEMNEIASRPDVIKKLRKFKVGINR
jgi:hypothetical protein